MILTVYDEMLIRCNEYVFSTY